jgi:hypothetical protein
VAGKKGRNASVIVNQYDLSRALKKASPSATTEIIECTAFQPPGGFKEKTVGDSDGKLSAEGYFRASDGTGADEVDDVLNTIDGSDTPAVLTAAPENADAVGKRAFLMLVDESSHSVDIPATGLIMVQAEFESSESSLEPGVILHEKTAVTATGNSASVDGGAATTTGAVAHQHVTASSEDGDETLDGIVQHSADDVTFVDLISFAQATGPTSERKEVTGTINRYTRYRRVVGGAGAPSFTPVVALARR